MSFIVVSIHRKDETINTLITKIGDPFIVELIYNNLEISPIIHRIGGINLSTRSLNNELRMKCGIVCSIDLAHKYIVVDEGPIWLTQFAFAISYSFLN